MVATRPTKITDCGCRAERYMHVPNEFLAQFVDQVGELVRATPADEEGDPCRLSTGDKVCTTCGESVER